MVGELRNLILKGLIKMTLIIYVKKVMFHNSFCDVCDEKLEFGEDIIVIKASVTRNLKIHVRCLPKFIDLLKETRRKREVG